MRGFVLVEFLGLALALIGTDEILQGGFTLRDHGLRAADFRFQFAYAVFHLLTFNGIQTLCFGDRRNDVRGLIAV